MSFWSNFCSRLLLLKIGLAKTGLSTWEILREAEITITITMGASLKSLLGRRENLAGIKEEAWEVFWGASKVGAKEAIKAIEAKEVEAKEEALMLAFYVT